MSDPRLRQLIQQYEDRAALLGAVTCLGLVLYAGPPPVGDWMQSRWIWLKLALLASFIGALLGKLFFQLLVMAQIIPLHPPCPETTPPEASTNTHDDYGTGFCDAGD